MEKPYALASWRVSAIEAAFHVTFLGTQLDNDQCSKASYRLWEFSEPNIDTCAP